MTRGKGEMGDSDLERLRRGVNRRISLVKTQRSEIGPGCSELWLDGSNEEECNK